VNKIVARQSRVSSTVISTTYAMFCYDFNVVHKSQDFRTVLYLR